MHLPSKKTRRRLLPIAGALAVCLLGAQGTAVRAQVVIPNVSQTYGRNSSVGIRGSNNATSTSSSAANSPFGDSSQQSDTSATKGLVFVKETPDSVLRQKVFEFRYRPAVVKIDTLWNPTLDPTGIQFADPLDGFNGAYYLGTGVVGHPHVNIFPRFFRPLAHRMQPDVHAGYAKRRGNLWLHQTLTPYTRLSYGSSLNKDYTVGVTHSQNIIPGWNVGFDYKLICPEGVYTNSGAKNHYLDFTTNYFSADSRLQAVGGVIWQSFSVGENGGLADDTYFTRQLQSNRAGVPVNLASSRSLHREAEAFGRVSYNLVRQVDAYRMRDTLVRRTVADTLMVTDTLHLVDTIPIRRPRVVNAGVVGAEFCLDRRKRRFADSTLWVEREATLFWTNDAYPDYRWHNPVKLTVGLNPHVLEARFATDTLTARQWLNPFAHAVLTAGRTSLTLDAERSGVFADAIDHHYAAALRVDLDSAAESWLAFEAAETRQQPYALMLHDAGAALEPVGTAGLRLNVHHRQMFDLDLMATRIDHFAWYDSSLAVQQGNSAFWVTQAALTLRLQWRFVHLDMQQMLQHSTSGEQLPLPLWASKNSLYVDFDLFGRALRLQVGVDVRYHTAFYAPAYSPQTGIFYRQEEYAVGNYLWADAFINLQVKRASIYAKAGHINALWESSPTYFLLPHYPGQRFGFFWGITWHFFD